MNVFDFVIKNADDMSNLDIDDEGNITIDPVSFDFGHPDLEIDVGDYEILFKVFVDPFALITNVDKYNLKDIATNLGKITNVDIRREIVDAIEKVFLPDIKENISDAVSDLKNAQERLCEVNEQDKEFSDGVRLIKNSWGLL